MTNIRRINNSNQNTISAQIHDAANNALWKAHEQNIDGEVIIQRVFSFEPSQIFFTLTREITRLNAFALDTSFLYAAYDDSTLLGEKISLTNPLTITTDISKPIGIVESPVDVKVNGSDLWFLLPGDSTGINTTLLRYNLSGVLQDTIELLKTGVSVQNAKKFTIDASGDLWITTYTIPTQTVRVFDTGGNIYDFEVTEITP